MGARAAEKARIFADEAIQRAAQALEHGAPDYVDVCVEVVGDEVIGAKQLVMRSREVAVFGLPACRSTRDRPVDERVVGVALGAPAGFSASRVRAPNRRP